jgi:hypothetical protein
MQKFEDEEREKDGTEVKAEVSGRARRVFDGGYAEEWRYGCWMIDEGWR